MSTARPEIALGDIVLAPFPYSNLSANEPRPVLIVGRSEPPDFIVAFVTSRLVRANSRAAHVIDAADPEFAATGLRVSSVIRLDRLATMHRDLLRRRLGHIGPRTREQVAACLTDVFGL